MVKVSVLYPNGPTTKFDTEYYKNSHLPMIAESLGDALKGMEFNIGVVGSPLGKEAPFVAMAHLSFETLETFQKSFGSHAQKFVDDVPNYTNVEGIIQISEIVSF